MSTPGLALTALAALFAAAPASAAPTFAPEVLQCDGSYTAGTTTRHPTPLLRAAISDPIGLKIGTPNQLGIVTGLTRALWRFDSGVAVAMTSQVGAIDCSAVPAPDEDRNSFHWDYTEPNGTQVTRLGTCVYDGDCFGGFVLNGGLSRVPVSLGACPGTPPAVGAASVFAASTLNAARFTNMATFNSALSQMSISQGQTIDWDLGPTYTLAAWIRTGSGGAQRVLSTQNGGKYWGFGLNGAGLRHFDSRDLQAGTTADFTIGSALVNNGSWHLIHVVRRNGLDRRYYVDGRLIGTTLATSTNSFSAQPISSSATIGGYSAGGEYFNGDLDDVRVLFGALGDDDVKLEFDATSHKYSSDGGLNFSTAAGSYTPSTPPTGSVGPVTYVPGEAWTVSGRWTFLAQNLNSATGLSATISVTRDTSAPSPPTSFSGTPTTTNDVTWSWAAPVSFCPPPGSVSATYTLVDPLTGLDVNPPGPLAHPTFSVGENFPGGPNQLRSRAIKAADTWGVSGLTTAATVYTLAAVPAALSFSDISSGSFVVSWSAAGNPAYTRYEVTYSLDNFASSVATRTALADDFTGTSVGFSNLAEGTTYYLRVRAFNGRSSDFFGGVPTAYLSGGLVTRPAAPVLTVTALSTGSVRYDWTSVSGATGYTLYGAGGAPVLYVGSALTFTSATLNVNTAYGGQIEANSPSGPGARTSAFVFTFASSPTTPSAPFVHATSVTFAWNANGNPSYTFYELNVSTDAAFTVVVATVPASTTQATATGLLPGTSYYARARALSGSQAPTSFLVFAATFTRLDSGITLNAGGGTPYAPGSGLVGQWHFDEGAGATSADLSGNANTALLTCVSAGCASTPTFTGGPPGLGSAVLLSGLNHGLARVPDAPALSFGGDVTVAAWAYPNTTAQPDGAGIVVRGDGGAESWALEISSSRFRFLPKPGFVAIATTTIAPNAWTHLLGSYDAAAGTATLYVNGRAAATVAVTPPRGNLAHDVSIGNRQSAAASYDRAFLGRVDGVRLFNRAFAAAEALSEYNGNSVSTVTASPPNDKVRVGLPPSAFSAPAVLYVSGNPAAAPIRVSAAALNAGLAAPPSNLTLAPGSLVEIVPVVNGLPFTADLGSSATVSIAYDDADGDNLLDGVAPPLPASGLRMFTLNTTVNRWEELPSVRDAANRRVTGTTPHFSVFALFAPSTIGASLSAVRAYPVPWKPGSGGAFDGPGVVFDRLPAAGSVSILSLSGESVVDFDFAGAAAGRAVWDGRNGAGRRVASGVYYARVKSLADGATVLLKLAIER